MFLGWYDPDRKRPAREKLTDALTRYQEKFRRTAESCLTSIQDAAEMAADNGTPDLPIKGVAYIPRYTFYVGREDAPAAAADLARAA